MKKPIILIGFILLAIACKNNPEKIAFTNTEDYNSYLSTSLRPTHEQALSSKDFWSKRLRADSTGVGDLSPLAGAYVQLFETTGDASFLKNAEQLYKKGMEISANGQDAFARSLAHNYISQHRFNEAYELLKTTFQGPSDKHETQLMLFDAAMEVGEYEKAYQYLEAVKNLKDYHYLIRLSKWSDYRGDLSSAIRYLEKAMTIAESRDSKPLKVWTYSNLGDYYGHAGRIVDSYTYYLKTLALQPDNEYVKKGIAWVLYSEEKNTEEAHRIMDSIMKNRQLPEDHLFKAELYTMEGKEDLAQRSENSFIKAVEEGAYGKMYNSYLIELYADRQPKRALKLAKSELENRPTPEVYHLLALAQLQNGMPEKALETIENHVTAKTSEPMALFHSALVYKANRLDNKVAALKEELAEATYELGPVISKKIEAL
ncbi:MAG: hypothetical protein AAF489_06150 [Bacteroidota bacterium]